MNKVTISSNVAANDITVVTGLPRSGTSMMMQMLVAGGLPALTDGQRQADQNNPRGYFEFEKVKSLHQDKSWVPQARGHAVKIIAQLLEYLPQENYRYIFMQRDLDEVVHSQQAMLQRVDKRGAQLSEKKLKELFAKHLLWAEKLIDRKSYPMLKVSFRACVEDASLIAAEVNRFLGGQLNEIKMAAAIDTKLYRQRN